MRDSGENRGEVYQAAGHPHQHAAELLIGSGVETPAPADLAQNLRIAGGVQITGVQAGSCKRKDGSQETTRGTGTEEIKDGGQRFHPARGGGREDGPPKDGAGDQKAQMLEDMEAWVGQRRIEENRNMPGKHCPNPE